VTLPLSPLVGVSDDPRIQRIEALSRQLEKANTDYDRWDRYYSGDQPLAFLAPEVVAQVGNRLAPLVINWPETIVDSVNRRVQAEGFLLGRGGVADDELGRIWSANEMHHEAPLGQIDALVHGLGFISVWGNDDDPETPLMTFESAHQVAVSYEPGTGDRILADALKRWQDGDETRANLFTPDGVFKFRSVAQAYGAAAARWELIEVLDNPLGVVPFVPMVNRGRLLNRAGRSELASIAPLADGINKLGTDLMVSAEFYVTPRRWMTGVQIPTDPAEKERFRAEMGQHQENAVKSKVWVGGEGVSYGQFPEADLAGFVAGIHLLTSALAAIGGLPPDDLGLNQVNPASAEARRAAETVLVLRAKEKQSAFGRAYTRAMRLAVAARDGVPLRALPTEFASMSVDWRDPATPAISQAMDAAVKGKDAGLLDVEAGQALFGMGPAERAAMKARAAEVAASTATAEVRAKLDLANELMRTYDLTQNAALAAVGMTQAAQEQRIAESRPEVD
jgi:hypothetical protein